jgi:hypothetical protein
MYWESDYFDLSTVADMGIIMRVTAMRYMWSLILSPPSEPGMEGEANLDLGLDGLPILCEESS